MTSGPVAPEFAIEASNFTLRVCTPLYWHDRRVPFPKDMRGGSSFIVRFGDRLIGITAAHVVQVYRNDREQNPALVCQLRLMPFALHDALIECDHARSAKWSAANPKRVRETKRKYRAANLEKLREKDRKLTVSSTSRTGTRFLSKRAAWRTENKEEIAAYRRQWYAKNKERLAAKRAAKRAAMASKRPDN